MRTPLNLCLLVVFSLTDGLSAQSFQAMQAPQGISGVAVTMNGNGIGCCTADFDGDGKTDAALGGSHAQHLIPVAFSWGDGTFHVTTGAATWWRGANANTHAMDSALAYTMQC